MNNDNETENLPVMGVDFDPSDPLDWIKRYVKQLYPDDTTNIRLNFAPTFKDGRITVTIAFEVPGNG